MIGIIKRNRPGLAGFVLIFLAALVSMAGAQDKVNPGLEAAPLNPEYFQYLEDVDSGKISLETADGYSLGSIPPHIDIDYASRLSAAREKPRISLPASYDLRTLGKVSSVKNQGNCGACWSFATLGALESNLLTGESWDFSENNMKNTHGFDIGCCAGGNTFLSTAYLTRWSGPIKESDDPYNDDETQCVSPPGLTPQKHLQEVIWFPKKTSALDNDAIKQAIMTYGGVHVSMCWTDPSYNAANAAYYYTGTENVGGHAVLAVGWDDNFDKNNFNTPPPGNGAFLIKNSWDTTFGQSGFFYISYYDSKMGYRNFQSIYTAAESTSNYEHFYYYDPLGNCDNVGAQKPEAWFGNVFTAAGNEQIKAVAWFVMAPNATYEIKVYLDPSSGPINPAGHASLKTGTNTTMGYKTILLDTPVSLSPGQKFSVVVKQTTPGYNYPIPVEYPISQFSSKADASAGQSYISLDGSNFSDLTTQTGFEKANVCLRVYSKSSSGKMCGDCNGDGKVTPGDAQWAFECYLGQHSGGDCDPSFTDVNSSGGITPEDAQAVFDNWLKGTALNCP